MPNYDFHSSFSPPEFESFVGDLLEIREGIPFERFGEGADGGIDLRGEDAAGNILIVQVKRYQNNFSQLHYVLKTKELSKIIKLAPYRYILVTSASLSPQNVDDIYALLSPYIQSTHDIIGREGINRLLGLPEYHDIEKRHYKLWLTSSNVLRNLLHEEIHRGILNDTKDELERIQNQLPLYVQNNSFTEALRVIDDHNFVMISGAPGVGKTMLGRALVAYHLEKRAYEELVYMTGSVDQAQNLYREERSQIFFFDDFWGSIFAKNPSDRNEDKRLLYFLEKIRGRSNKKLVLTTREYVFQQGARRQNYPELARFLNKTKCIVSPETYTKVHRAQILLNHLYFSDLDENSLRYFITLKEYKHVIEHRNYTPRLISTFIQNFNQTDKEPVFFGKEFLKFLKNPYDFYADIFEKQTDIGKLILLFIFISNDPIRYDDLYKTLKCAIEPARSLGFKIDLVSFSDTLTALENTFVVISETSLFKEKELKVDFINPSVNDFLLRYLRENIEVYGDILIQSACFFNQLDFVFDTCPDSHISDDSEEPVFGESIIITGEQRTLLKNKYLKDFDSLTYSTLDPGIWRSQYTCHSQKKDTMVWELIRLMSLFNLEADVDIKKFVIEKYNKITTSLLSNSTEKAINHESMMNYPQLTKILIHQIKMDFNGIIPAFYNSITFISEFIAFKWLGEAFPDEYSMFVDENLRAIRKNVVELAFDDADYFAHKDDMDSLGKLVDMDIDEVFGMFNMRATRQFIARVYQAADLYPPNYQAHEHAFLELEEIAAEEDEDYNASKVEQDYSSLLDEPSWDNYLEDDDIDDLMSTLKVDIEAQSKIRRLLECINFINDRLVLTLTCEALTSGYIDPAITISELIDSLIEFQLSKNLEATEHGLPLREAITQLEIIAYNTFFETHLITSKNIQRQLAKKVPITQFSIDEFIMICSPFIIIKRQHIKFISDSFGMHLAVRHISKLNKADNTHFYKETFNNFAEDKFMVSDGWLDIFVRLDEDNFFHNIAQSIIQEAIKELEHIPHSYQLWNYLKLLQLNFSLRKQADEENYEHGSSSVRNWIINDLVEFFSLSFTDSEIIDWFSNALNENLNEQKGQLIRLFTSEPEDTECEILSIDFSDRKPTAEELVIIDQIDAVNGFSSLLSKFRTKLQLILQSERLLIDSEND